MAIKFQFIEAAGAGNLGPAVTVADLLAGIAGFQGLFTAGIGETLTAGKISAWAARRGVGKFSQATAARHANKAQRDGLDVLSFDGTNALGLDTVIGTPTAFTIGMRFFQKSFATDAQILFGQDLATPFSRIESRNTAANHYYRYAGENTTPAGSPDVPEADAWHTLIISQGGGQAKLIVDNAPVVAVTSTGLNLPTFSLGAARNVSGSARIDVRSIFFAASDVSASPTVLANLKSGLAKL